MAIRRLQYLWRAASGNVDTTLCVRTVELRLTLGCTLAIHAVTCTVIHIPRDVLTV
jgi:hypothetical protein